MEEFCVELAGVAAEVRCRYAGNRTFLSDYITNKEPLFTVTPSTEDLEQMQADLDRMDEAEGIPRHRRADEFLENNAIHALLAERLVEENVLLMHGSALCMDGRGIIFTAPSGTGKSTHARLWREMYGNRVWMVNDDKARISLRENGVQVWGSPWDGKHRLSRNASAPLKAVVNLERSETNHIEPMGRADAFPVLMKQCYVSKDSAKLVRIMDLEKRLLDAVDFYNLGCNMKPEAAKVAWKGLNAQ